MGHLLHAGGTEQPPESTIREAVNASRDRRVWTDHVVGLRASVAILVLGSLAVAAFIFIGLALTTSQAETPIGPGETGAGVVLLTQEDFLHGTYIIDRPGTYMLAEDISFNPNSPATLTAAIRDGEIDRDTAASLGLPLPPVDVDAYRAGFPLPTQFARAPLDEFVPGGPLDRRYDPAAFGLGFFAAIVVAADDVVLDLNGHTLEQSAEHALLMRFFALIELADRPFISGQGPAEFGSGIKSGKNIVIRNGTLGRSSHHGIHGNLNEGIRITNIDFVDYEVGAVALNGVTDLRIDNVNATNRKDVPVLGTFSSAQFIKAYVDELVRTGSTTELTVGGKSYDAAEVQETLRASINAVHHDIVAEPNIVDGRPQIDEATNPDEYALFSNPFGVVDGNSYSFLTNAPGVAVNGFPVKPYGEVTTSSTRVRLTDVHVRDQWAFINEIPAISNDGTAIIDPVGAVFQVFSSHPDTGEPVTVSTLDPRRAEYRGNVVANAQALVGNAFLNGDFADSRLDLTRLNITPDLLAWVEGATGSETLGDLVPDPATGFLCNGDSMFHVNKGVIAFKMDAATEVFLYNTSASGIRNLGQPGTSLCGDYSLSKSHPMATLDGYGGAAARAFSFAGSEEVQLFDSSASDISAASGDAAGIDVLTDSRDVVVWLVEVNGIAAGTGADDFSGPNRTPEARGFRVGPDATDVTIESSCATGITAQGGQWVISDESGTGVTLGVCSGSSGRTSLD